MSDKIQTDTKFFFFLEPTRESLLLYTIVNDLSEVSKFYRGIIDK